MKKRAVSMILAAAMVCGMMAANVSCVSAKGSDEGKVINIYSWNDEFRQRLEAIYPEVESTSKDGTVTKLKDGTEIHWIVNPNQDGVYQQKLDEALLNQADASADDYECPTMVSDKEHKSCGQRRRRRRSQWNRRRVRRGRQ